MINFFDCFLNYCTFLYVFVSLKVSWLNDSHKKQCIWWFSFFTTNISFQDLVVGIPSSHNCKGLDISLVVILKVIGLVAFTDNNISCILSATFYHNENVYNPCLLNSLLHWHCEGVYPGCQLPIFSMITI